MRRELVVKTRSLAGTSDVTILAPIKPGLVPSLESVTYTTRTKRILGALTAGRTSSHEFSLLRAFSDAVERVGKIHSVRIAVIERDESKGDPPDEPGKILLAVTFDGGADSYVRVLWQKVGILLDVIFCNTVGYVTAWDHTFEEWAGWIRSVQIEADFLYGTPGLTVDDVQYLRKHEWVHRKRPGKVPLVPLPPNEISADLEATREAVKSVEELSWSQIDSRPDVIKDLGRQGIRALALLYRLSAYYVPGTVDGALLHRAARELLQEFIRLDRDHLLDQVIKEGEKRFLEQLTWLRAPFPGRDVPRLPDKKPEPDPVDDVQAGIISAYPSAITHGCLLLLAFRGFEGGGSFLELLAEKVARYGLKLNLDRQAFVNVHLTYEGFRALGLSETQLAFFPQEFREGMEARASVLGDLRINHPRRWRLPERNVFEDEKRQTLELSSVHAILQVRAVGKDLLDSTLRELMAELRDHVDFLSIQPMLRHLNEQGSIREHFGFADGGSDPVLDPRENGRIYDRNRIQLGEILLGYDNEADFAEDPAMAPDPRRARERLGLLRNGSFLVVRKLAQDVRGLDAAIRRAAAATGLDAELILAKMMGRWKDGRSLVTSAPGNDFDYTDEIPPGQVPPGSACPFHAHIRRTNPRTLDDSRGLPLLPGRRTPRLMRRGMTYGSVYEPIEDPKSVGEPRGLVFMAYNSSIAEQFEVVQRWISGGNSSGGFSGQSDPFLGVPPIGHRKRFRFEHEAQVYQVELDGPNGLLQEPQPFVRLDWGIYLFTPSISALRKLAVIARERANVNEEHTWSVEDGCRQIRELLALEKENNEKARQAWKAILEDPEAQRTFRSAGVWAAIRQHHGGVLQTAYGVIVAERNLVRSVLENEGGLCSVSGYHERMLRSLGEIYLGLDDHGKGCPYRDRSEKVNAAIGELTREESFGIAHGASAAKIQALVDNERRLAGETGESTWELNFEVKEVVDHALAALCQRWFGLPTAKCEIEPGGSRWDWKPGEPVRYPGHFTAPSRYFFQPWPGDTVEQYGIRYGEAIRQSFAALIKRHRDNPAEQPVLDATRPITAIILDTFKRREGLEVDPAADDLAGRTMAGAMMGFLPTLDGNLRLSLNEWLRDGSFWSLRGALKDRDPRAAFRTAGELLEQPLRKAMQLRPSPELVWRTVTRDCRIGTVPVKAGDKVVISLVSATQQARAASWPTAEADVYPIFGGNRREDPHPTHACPGYEAAMGALLGVIYALLERKEAMRPSPAPLALTLEGKVDGAKPRAPQRAAEAPLQEPPVVTRTPPSSPTLADARPSPSANQNANSPVNLPLDFGRGHLLIAAGDSWFKYFRVQFPPGSQNIVEYLGETPYSFTVENLASSGLKLEDFYTNPRIGVPSTATKRVASSKKLDELVKAVQRYVNRGRPPVAILFSASGNDVKEGSLTQLLKKAAAMPNPDEGLDDDVVKEKVCGLMKAWLTAVLTKLTQDWIDPKGARLRIPVFIHGYDFPVPDARGLWGSPRPDDAWLYTSFKTRLWETAEHPAYPPNGTKIMNALITRLNKMQSDLVAKQFAGRAYHVDLTKTLSSKHQDYEKHLENELHPTEPGFRAVARKFAESLYLNIPLKRDP